MEVFAVAGVAWFAGGEVRRRRSFGWRRFWLIPAATERGNKGKPMRGVWGFQIEAEEERGRHVPHELRRAEAAELELDLELGCFWRGLGGSGGCFGAAEVEW